MGTALYNTLCFLEDMKSALLLTTVNLKVGFESYRARYNDVFSFKSTIVNASSSVLYQGLQKLVAPNKPSYQCRLPRLLLRRVFSHRGEVDMQCAVNS